MSSLPCTQFPRALLTNALLFVARSRTKKRSAQTQQEGYQSHSSLERRLNSPLSKIDVLASAPIGIVISFINAITIHNNLTIDTKYADEKKEGGEVHESKDDKYVPVSSSQEEPDAEEEEASADSADPKKENEYMPTLVLFERKTDPLSARQSTRVHSRFTVSQKHCSLQQQIPSQICDVGVR
eukprot:scaffold10560_cov272-Chaetoceros_neogracile.AAC.6